MNKPHPHADVIKAWADGAQTQYYALGEWHDMVDEPVWYRDRQFRIKPDPKPDVVRFVTYEWNPINERTYGGVPDQKQQHFSNLKLTFDGETGKLKLAEVL